MGFYERVLQPGHENKQKLCNFLLYALQETDELYALRALHYSEESEVVIAEWLGGEALVINVRGDSGLEMIQNIVTKLR